MQSGNRRHLLCNGWWHGIAIYRPSDSTFRANDGTAIAVTGLEMLAMRNV